MPNKQVWVSPNPSWGWRVYKPGDKRDIVHIDNKQEAMNRAREIARNQEAELKVQNRDGKISQSNSYGKDPFPPKG